MTDKHLLKYSVYLLLIVGGCCGQSISIGVKGGTRALDDAACCYATSESRRYVVGPMLQIGLPFRLSVEVDALYRRVGSTSLTPGVHWDHTRQRINSWEFPLLLRYEFRVPAIRPYLEGGYAPRVGNGTYASYGVGIDPQYHEPVPYSYSGNTSWDVSHGIVAGGGVQISAGRWRFSPEIRYTRWHVPGFAAQTASNQLDVMVGIGWKLR